MNFMMSLRRILMKQKWIALLMTGSLLLGAGGTYAGMQWFDRSSGTPSFEKINDKQVNKSTDLAVTDSTNLEKVSQAYDLILSRYVEKVDRDKLTEGAIQGMLSVLKDPYSVYMDKETAKQFTQTLESSFEGIGAEVGMEDGKIIIVSPFKNSPAEKAGLRPNDQILKVDGKSINGLNLNEATLKIRGKRRTKVNLEIAWQSVKEPLTISVKRDEIPLETVHSSLK